MKFTESISVWTQHWRATEQTQDVQKQCRQSPSGYTNLPRCGEKLVWPPAPHLRIKDFVVPEGVDSATLTIHSVFSNYTLSLISFTHYHNARKWVFCPPVLENPKLAPLSNQAGARTTQTIGEEDWGFRWALSRRTGSE